MKKTILFGCSVLALVVLAPGAVAQTTSSDEKVVAVFAVDAAKAKAGATVFAAKACSACHTIGKEGLVGPDLAGLLERRSETWVKTWLRDPTPMFETDETAKALLKEYDNVKMPNMNLSEAQIDQLLHYIADQGAKAKKKQP